ncbi:MAG TPA: thiol oxidoreductase, partial [Hyphomicrobiaceae bacterium]|nr:thiol oxidoreductase [Hyphomicrobiaceae bacterium]
MSKRWMTSLLPALVASAGTLMAATAYSQVAAVSGVAEARPTVLQPGEDLPGGQATTLASPIADAFSHFSANMGFAKELDFKLGNGLFRRQWVSAPSSTRTANGLGPLFNARG